MLVFMLRLGMNSWFHVGRCLVQRAEAMFEVVIFRLTSVSLNAKTVIMEQPMDRCTRVWFVVRK